MLIQKRNSFLLLALMTPVLLFAQGKKDQRYRERLQEIKDELKAEQNAAFSNTEVPAVFKDASAVILAKEVEIYAAHEKKFSLNKYNRQTFRFSVTTHEKIKIQDKNALEEYSQFSFSKIRSESSMYNRKANLFYGVVVIKPNGERTEIDIDDEAVSSRDDDGDEKYKLAIPNLQIGDMLEVFTRAELQSPDDSVLEPMDVVIGGEYPIVKYLFHTQIDKDLAAIYSCTDDRFDPKKKKDAEFNYLYFEADTVNGKTDDMWVYTRRELPVFRLNVIPGAKMSDRTVTSPPQGQIVKGLQKAWVERDIGTRFAGAVKYSNAYLSQAQSYLNDLKKKKKISSINPDSLIQYAYYYGRYLYLYGKLDNNNYEVGAARNTASTDYDFYSYLFGVFNEYNIRYDLLFTVTRQFGTISDAISTGDFIFFARAKGNKEYYLMPPSMFTYINQFPAAFEGQDAYVFNKASLVNGATARARIEKIPETKAMFNYQRESLQVKLDPEKPEEMLITRVNVQRGNLATDDRVRLALFEDYVDKERAEYAEDSYVDYMASLASRKEKDNLLSEYRQGFQRAREQQKDFAEKEVKSSFGDNATELADFKVLGLGSRHNSLDFSFSEKFRLAGEVKKAGPNLIIGLSSLLTNQLQVAEDQRKRLNNIYMPFARVYEYDLSFEVPEGYQVEGLDKLQRDVQNETGGFVANASMEGKKLVLRVKKTYAHNYESIDHWSELLAFLDAAYDFSQQKILLKKM